MLFCQYSDILGTPGTGFHAYRFLGLAVFDLMSVLIIALLLNLMFKKYTILFWITKIFSLAEFLHAIFCVRTAFLENYSPWVAIPILIFCAGYGFFGNEHITTKKL